jgi:3-hydroxyisobutyrate dehydrogenase-like beta-hydroxyacid dehydrogenase
MFSNSGTETVSALLADGLRQAGHEVVVFAPTLGGLAQGMRARGHKVHDRIDQITEKPDVIHAHHLMKRAGRKVYHAAFHQIA